MVNFVERATLILNDQSSKPIDKINAALRRMRKEASATQKALSRFRIPNVDGRQAAKVDALAKSLRNLNKQAAAMKRINANIKIGGASAADVGKLTRALNAYQKMSNGLLGAKQMKFHNLDTLVTKLVRVARSANMAAIAMGKLKTNIPGNQFNVRNYTPRQPNGRSGVNLNLQPLRSLFRSFIVDLGHQLTNAIRYGIGIGTKDLDVAGNKLRQQRLPPELQKTFEDRAFSESQKPGGAGLRAGQRLDLYAELLPNFKNPTDALKFDETINKAIAVSIQQGQTIQQATDGLAQMFRGLGGAGYLVNNDGSMDPRVLKYIDAYTAAKVSEGAQINFRDFFQSLKYGKTTSQALSPQAVFLQLVMAADVGASTSGVQANMLSKSLSAGETTKKALTAQFEAGFREPFREVETGSVGGKKVKQLVGGELKDEEMFLSNPLDWIQKYVTGPGGYLEQQGLDVNTASPAQLVKALNPLSANRNADDAISKAVAQMTESLIKLDKFYNNQLSTDEIIGISDQSSFVTLQETTNKIITTLGVFGDSLEGVVIPILKFVGEAADSITNAIRGTGESSATDYAAVGLAGTGAVIAGKAVTKLIGFGLPGAATALNTSAGLLSKAAYSLMGAGGGATGNAGATAAGAAGAAAGGGPSWLGLVTLAASAAAAAVTLRGSVPKTQADAVATMFQERVGGKINGKVMALQMELESKQLRLTQLQAEVAQAKSIGVQGSSNYMLDRTAEIASLTDQTSQLRAEITTGTAELRSIFEQGAAQITQASSNFGPSAGESLLGIASSFGSAAGEAMKSVFGTPSVNVNQSTAPIPNLGTNTNLATGG